MVGHSMKFSCYFGLVVVSIAVMLLQSTAASECFHFCEQFSKTISILTKFVVYFNEAAEN